MPLIVDELVYVAGGVRLLDGISARIPRGSKTVVLGPNGSGKSLFLRLCHGLLQPTDGRVRWSGLRPGDRQDGARHRQAMVFQHPILLRRSALANVTYALSARGVPYRRRRKMAEEALERMGMLALARRSARVLSGGEQQRLALAGAWALHPEVLFLDEPTANLDPAATRAVEEAIAGFHTNGTTIVMTTHDLGQARRLADEVLFLFKGRLLEQTPAEEFFRRPRSAEAQAFVAGELVW
jgi:tungstate transport system ATP-binding protein